MKLHVEEELFRRWWDFEGAEWKGDFVAHAALREMGRRLSEGEEDPFAGVASLTIVVRQVPTDGESIEQQWLFHMRHWGDYCGIAHDNLLEVKNLLMAMKKLVVDSVRLERLGERQKTIILGGETADKKGTE